MQDLIQQTRDTSPTTPQIVRGALIIPIDKDMGSNLETEMKIMLCTWEETKSSIVVYVDSQTTHPVWGVNC